MSGSPLAWVPCVFVIYYISFCGCAAPDSDVEQWLGAVNDTVTGLAHQMTSAEWAFFSNVTDDRRISAEGSQKAFRDYVIQVAQQASSKTASHDNVNMSIQLNLWKSLSNGGAVGNEQWSPLKLQMLQLTSETLQRANITSGFSDDFDALLKAWRSLHDDDNRPQLRSLYEQYVNSAPTLVDENSADMDDVTSPMMTLYRQLHTYVREELRNSYGPHRLPATGHIPAHLVDGADGVSWYHLLRTVLPYKFAQRDFNSSQISGVKQMLELVNQFYQSLGYSPLPDTFMNRSRLTRPADHSTVQVCHPPAVWNFQDRQDYRLTSCLDVSHLSMRSAVQLVGDLQAQRFQYDLPFILQETSDTDYVTEAVSGALSMAFFSPAHLRQIGLQHPASAGISADDEINFLMEVALDRLPLLASYHVISQWQTTVAGTSSDEWNNEWWRLRCTVEGVSSAISRDMSAFDAGASTDLLLNVPGKRLLQSAVAQFQILKAMCDSAGHNGSLSTCNLRENKDVGQKIREVLNQGRLLTPAEKLRRLTGVDQLNISAMADYFSPLSTWLSRRPVVTDTPWAAACPDPDTGKVKDAGAVEDFLEQFDTEARRVYENDGLLAWNYECNITDYNKQLMVNNSVKSSQFAKQWAWQSALFDSENVKNATQKRMLEGIGDIGVAAIRDQNKIKRLNEVLANMSGIYSTAKVCFTQDHCVPLDPDITRLFAKSRNYTELTEAWRLWRDATGLELKDLYQEFVTLGNEGVRQMGMADMGEYWRHVYEDENFQQDLEDLLEQLLPLYEQLHTYVRKKLKTVYGAEKFPRTGHIPAHLLGNMWAQQWNNIYDLLVPFPNKQSVDVTQEMVNQNWTVTQMFNTSEEFYKSLGLSAMPERFWEYSMLEKPDDGREVVCHASAWNFYNGQDFRIKMCTDITMEDLITVHHEMGHIQYYLQYKDLPILFQAGANPGFHEAIGDTMALSVATPEHLQKIGLLVSAPQDDEADINFLLKMALEKVSFLPFGYLIDQWRWSVFSGDTTPQHYNDHWWKLRCKLQGLSPPVTRTADDFDPGAKFHVPDNTPYIRYFVSFVLQFTFYQRLCDTAKHTGPLHRCDFYQSQEAGGIFQEMLQKGSSEPWQDILQALNGQRSMDASAILAYFRPLSNWLADQNKGETPGWTDHCPAGTTEKIRDETMAKEWLHRYDQDAKQIRYENAEMAWNYATNVTDENQKNQVESDLSVAQWQQKKAAEVNQYDWQHFADDMLVRQFRMAADIGTSALKNHTKLKELKEVQSTIKGIYAKAKVVDAKTGTPMDLEPGLTRLMASSRDYDELLMAWKGWRDVTGPLMKSGYEKFVALSNEALKTLGYKDTGEHWRSMYESDSFQADLESLLSQLSPLYTQLHAFVRRKLMDEYGASRFPYSGHIPAHLLGNMWSQSWTNLYEFLQPFPNKSAIDVTPELHRQGYTVERMFTTAEEFFTSLGLEPIPMAFWQKSMMERPRDGRDVVCHASAWDFANGKDFRIKMCTDITMDDLITIHHEMGHIQYYLQYKSQPYLFRSGANPGFHEAIGDTLALSVSTPKHLKTIQLLKTVEEDPEADVNYLLMVALEKIAFLPFGYLIDQWRWSVFSGDTTPEHYNDHWWNLRCKYQGVSSPVSRNSTDFDPGAKYHVPANTPYIRYFVASVLQFQFYKALCDAAGHEGSLHTCDFHRSKEAGQLLSKMLQLGSSKPWPDALEQITGSRSMDVTPMLDYFKPLSVWLEAENAGYPIGWDEECPREDLTRAASWLEEYDEKLGKELEESTFADWGYITNITDENSALSVKGQVKLATFRKEETQKAEQFHWRNLSDSSIRRQFQHLTNIGPSAMRDAAKFEEMQTLQSKMEGIYGSGKVCFNGSSDCLPLEPDLEDILATRRDYDRLLEVWVGWRNATGRRMKTLYQQFVNLSNQGVREIGYADTGKYWQSYYESPTFEEDLKNLLDQLSPLYQQLHAYVRHKLIGVYGEERFPESGHIPAHLLGNMWAQQWNNIYDLVEPFPNRTGLDVTAAMQNQNYTVRKMFRKAEAFFSSLGFECLPPTFWQGSVLEKPLDREIVCHASAWDFYNAKDFRIKMCTSVNQEDLVTIHHEMGHIQYFMQYRHQPQVFRDGANPGFHEAVGDTIALSVSTPAHLRKIKLLQEGEDEYQDEINFLLKMALEKVSFLPFGYLIDQWRWSVFSGDTTPEHYNDHWWNLRCRYQGISPPVARSADDFDPGAKYHIPGNTPYIRYFASFVLQFQFQEALCKAAGHTGPLHKCDVFHSQPAGELLRSMLRKGSSVPWPDLLEAMTGGRKMDAGALLDYFSPLQHWLEKQNGRQRLGWTWQCPDVHRQTQTQTTATPDAQSRPTAMAVTQPTSGHSAAKQTTKPTNAAGRFSAGMVLVWALVFLVSVSA